MRRLLIFAALWLSASLVSAQSIAPPTPVQQTAMRLDAANKTATSATSAAVLSLLPNPGESIYLYEIDVANCAGASAVVAAAPTTISTTNIDGGMALTVGSGVTAGQCQPFPPLIYPTGLKSQAPNLPVTITLPAFATNQTIRVNAVYRSAP